MKRMLQKICSVTISATLLTGMFHVVSADDLSGHWAESVMRELQSKKYISGYEDNNLRPNAPITRAEFVTVVNKVMELSKVEVGPRLVFSDVKDGDWFKEAVEVAISNGYTMGYGDNSFRPNAKITRAEAAVMLSKVLKLDTKVSLGEMERFTDSENIPIWAAPSIRALMEKSLMSGYPSGDFKANSPITRAEAFSVLHKSYTSDIMSAKKEEESKKEEVKTEALKKLESPKKPSTGSNKGGGTGGSSGGGSHSSAKAKAIEIVGERTFSEDNQIQQFTIQYTPHNASNKKVNWYLSNDNLKIIEKTDSSIRLQAVENGEYELIATLDSDASVTHKITGQIKNQVVGLTSDSNIGTAGDKSITGLNKDQIYVLKVDSKYLSINAEGKIVGTYDSKEKAVVNSQSLNTTAITGLDNAKEYELFQFSAYDDEVLQAKIAKFLAYTKDDINEKNVDMIQILHLEVHDGADQKVNSIQDQVAKKIWEEKLEQIKNKYEELKPVINQKQEALDRIIEAIKENINKIQEGMSPENARKIVSDIDGLVEKISVNKYQKIEPDLRKKFTNLKAELEQYEKMKDTTVTLNDDGTVTIAPLKTKVNMDLVTEQGDLIKQYADLNPSSNIPSVLKDMRNAGVGNYQIKVTLPDTTYLKVEYVSELKEVKKIENTLGILFLRGSNFNEDPDKSTENSQAKVRFHKEKGTIEWDAVENATSYDVFADFTLETNEPTVGGVYIMPEKGNHNEFGNIENEYQTTSLISIGNGQAFRLDAEKGQVNRSRVAVATGLTERKLNLNTLAHVEGDAFSHENFLKDIERDKIHCFVKIFIVPRNINSLYISQHFEKPSGVYKLNYTNALEISDFTWGDWKQFNPAW